MTHIATCHCGGTRIEVPEAPTHATSCTCTFCSKSGGLWAYYPPEAPRILSDTRRAMYTASGFNEHYFCGHCGCATYGISPDWTLGSEGIPERKKFALNARLLDDFELKSLVVVVEIDGRNLW
jgi:hypothetical protein